MIRFIANEVMLEGVLQAFTLGVRHTDVSDMRSSERGGGRFGIFAHSRNEK